MPKRTDLKSILLLGSGPIVIGQGCEFDYSGTQACRALRSEGYRVVLINSNPATIMTDPEMADATYVEPITPEAVEKILVREKEQGTPVDAVLPTLGGQTGLNVGMACWDQGIFQKHGVEMIGANREAIWKGEDRQAFKDLMLEIGLKVPLSETVHTMEDARAAADRLGLPLIIRPAFTLGGTGGGIAYNRAEFDEIAWSGLDASPTTEILIEQSVLGWKEFELEVVRDKADNAIVICGIENLDPMGVHTGDSITVAPIQTLTDKEYQRMRDAALKVIRAVGVETGGSNIQFAVNPADGEMVVVEMNPRVSRSSALASKATGFPIAKIAAKLAVGYTLDELPNDITGTTSACFEPTIDYVVVKMPRWTFEKFPEADETLTTQMKSVGEAMAIGRTFKEALQKAIRSMEVGRFGLGLDSHDKSLATRHDRKGVPRGSRQSNQATSFPEATSNDPPAKPGAAPPTTVPVALPDGRASSRDVPEWPIPEEKLNRKLAVPSQGRLYYVRYALKMGWSVERVHELSKIDPWFLEQIAELVEEEETISAQPRVGDDWEWDDYLYEDGVIPRLKQLGYSDIQLSTGMAVETSTLRRLRDDWKDKVSYKLVDTCAAEFEAATPYYYSSYETPYSVVGWASAHHPNEGRPASDGGLKPTLQQSETLTDDEIRVTDRPKVVIIGGGPNRIGQGIEFDYCCCQAAFAARELGLESVMINSNPETVSTDYDTSDLLFFEPLTHEDVLNVCERLNGASFGVAAGPAPRSDDRPAPESRGGPRGYVRGVVVQFGGQTPLNLAKGLEDAGVPILGTSVDAIHRAGSREQFRDLIRDLRLKQPANGIARSVEEAKKIAADVGYPVLVRPSFVLGGRAMEIVYDEAALDRYMTHALAAAGMTGIADSPILVDKFLDGAVEVDVDCVADYQTASATRHDREGVPPGPRQVGPSETSAGGSSTTNASVAEPGAGSTAATSVALPHGRASSRSVICGVMEHIEEAGIHSGDSACVLPPHSLSNEVVDELKRRTHELAKALQVCGLMNVQYAVRNGEVFVIEVNPRASRTVPFVGKATGVNWARIAAKVMMGATLDDLGVQETPPMDHVAVKEAVFPFAKFPGTDVILGPEMKSTGEVMGIDRTFPLAYAKATLAEGTRIPDGGTLFVSVRQGDHDAVVPVARKFADLGFKLVATRGTLDTLTAAGVEATLVNKIADHVRPNLLDLIANKEVQLIVNTPTRKGSGTDEAKIRAAAFRARVPIVTTLTAADAWAGAIAALREKGWDVKPLQAWHAA